jgi:hypothetical protein
LLPPAIPPPAFFVGAIVRRQAGDVHRRHKPIHACVTLIASLSLKNGQHDGQAADKDGDRSESGEIMKDVRHGGISCSVVISLCSIFVPFAIHASPFRPGRLPSP